jgi:hypothetical protein
MREKAMRMVMRSNAVLALIAVLGGYAVPARAEDQQVPTVAAASALTPQQFEALPPTAVIEIDGRRITKEMFLSRREAALDRTFNKMKAQRGRAASEFALARKAMDGEKATLDEANRKVLAEVERLRSGDAERHGPNWDARREQAASLLKQAASADPLEQSRLEKQAADLLDPASARP